jgi:hypothetical protein
VSVPAAHLTSVYDDLLRDAPLGALLAALDVNPADPRCSACHGPLEIGGNERTGFSFSCNGTCRLARLGFQWAPSFAAELWRTPTIAGARTRLVAAIERYEPRQRVHAPEASGHTNAVAWRRLRRMIGQPSSLPSLTSRRFS